MSLEAGDRSGRIRRSEQVSGGQREALCAVILLGKVTAGRVAFSHWVRHTWLSCS